MLNGQPFSHTGWIERLSGIARKHQRQFIVGFAAPSIFVRRDRGRLAMTTDPQRTTSRATPAHVWRRENARPRTILCLNPFVFCGGESGDWSAGCRGKRGKRV
jgi:hypothetical protein